MTGNVVTSVCQIFGVILIGWIVRRLGYLKEEDINRWSRIVFDVLFPLLIFHTMTRRFESDRFAQLWPLPFIGLGIILVGAAAGVLLRAGLKTRDLNIRKTFHHLCAINNYGFLPIVLVQELWGEGALAKLFFMNLGSTIGFWTVGVGLLGEPAPRKALRGIVTPGLITVLLSLVLCVTGINRFIPELVHGITGAAGSAAVPVILMLIGASLYPIPSLRHKRDLAYTTIVRLVLLPALLILGLWSLPVSPDVRNITFIVALMPCAVSSTILTRRYGGCPDFAGNAAVLTTILSMATIPAFLILIEKLIGFAT